MPVPSAPVSPNPELKTNFTRNVCQQATMCRELFKLAREGQQWRQQRAPKPRLVTGTRFQQWSFFLVAAFWLYLRWDTALTSNVLCFRCNFSALQHVLTAPGA